MNLTQNFIYRGRGIVSVPTGVNKANATSALESKGFTEVQVWLDEEELPADWPAERRSDESGMLSTQVWVQGRWSRESGEVEDSGSMWHVVDVWEVPQAQGTDEFTCTTEGYSCDPAHSYCCADLSCTADETNRYGGGNRCQLASVAPVKPGSGWWWLLGLVGVVAVVGVAWWAMPKRSRARNPWAPTWRDFIRGEWWLVPGQEAQFADQEVGEAGHRQLALDAMFDNNVLVAWLVIEGMLDAGQEQEARDNGAAFTIDTARAVWGLEVWPASVLRDAFMKDVRFKAEVAQEALRNPYMVYMEFWGAIRVAGPAFQMFKLGTKQIEAIQSFLLEHIADAAPDRSSITIEDVETGSTEISIEEFLVAKRPRDVWRR